MNPVDQRYAGIARQLTGARLHRLGSVDSGTWVPGEAGCFLGRFDKDAMLDELVVHRIVDGLRRRGHERVTLELDAEHAERSVVRLWSRTDLIVELIVWREYLEVLDDPANVPELRARFRGVAPQPVLTAEWLQLQDPQRAWSRAQQRMPGQHWPGLGVADDILAMLRSWSVRLGASALLTLPDHFHSAVLFERAFRFLDPELEGLLRRARLDLDLARRGLAEVSWSFERGLVGLEHSDGTLVRPWRQPSEVELVAVSGPLQAWLESAAWSRHVRETLETHRFVEDRQAWRREQPMPVGGWDELDRLS